MQSAEFYLGAVETAVAKKIIDDPTFKPSSCDIQADGNLKCDGTDVKIEISGEAPTSGTITLQKGKITEVTLVLSEKTITKNNEGKLVYSEGSNIVFEGETTFTLVEEDDLMAYYFLDVSLDQTKFKNHSNYKITIDNDKVYEVICTKNNGDAEYSEKFVLGNKSTFLYIYDESERDEIFHFVVEYDNLVNLDGKHNMKIEYVEDEVYPHVLRVGPDSLQIFSTELVVGEAIIEIKGSDVNPTNVQVDVQNDNGYKHIKIGPHNPNVKVDDYYKTLQEGKIITVTVKQGDNNYELGGSNFIEQGENEYDCYFSDDYKYYYWGNNKIGFLDGC